MNDTRKPKPRLEIEAATGIVNGIFFSSGRRNIRIFGGPPHFLVMVTVGLILVGMPFALILAVIPIWQPISDLALVRALNAYIAPAIESLPDRDRSFLVACSIIVELIFLGNFITAFSRGVRKHALLVWICYDREKLLGHLTASGILFFCLWYVLFVDWRFMSFINSIKPTGRLVRWIDVLVVVGTPLISLLFGHLLMIATLGVLRDIRNRPGVGTR